MVIPIKANNKIELKKMIKMELLRIKSDDQSNMNNHILAQSIDQIIQGIHKNAEGDYVTNIFLYDMPMYYNYHGLISEDSLVR